MFIYLYIYIYIYITMVSSKYFKTNYISIIGAVQVEVNLQEQLNEPLHFRKLKCCKKARYMSNFTCMR